MTINQKKSLVAFYLSKYNNKAFEQLGYTKITEALDDLSEKLKGDGIGNSYIKRRRDEFDVFFDNGRNGQKNRKPTAIVYKMYTVWNVLSFDELSELVNSVINETDGEITKVFIEEDISESEIEYILNFEDKDAAIIKKYKEISERKYDVSKINALKKIYRYRCQICGINVGEEYGIGIAEAHHIKYFSKSMDNSSDNILILCPNHHSLIHKLNPKFDYENLQYIYQDGKIDKLKIDLHLGKDEN